MKIRYVALFTEADGEYLVEIPDLGVMTQGNDEGDALYMAIDAAMVKLNCLGEYPPATDISEIDETSGTFSEEGKTSKRWIYIDLR